MNMPAEKKATNTKVRFVKGGLLHELTPEEIRKCLTISKDEKSRPEATTIRYQLNVSQKTATCFVSLLRDTDTDVEKLSHCLKFELFSLACFMGAKSVCKKLHNQLNFKKTKKKKQMALNKE